VTLTADEAAIIKEAIDHLRRLAIVEIHTPGIQAVVVCGHRCKVCSSKWHVTETERHEVSCILKGSEL
jgi:hypothetical protein